MANPTHPMSDQLQAEQIQFFADAAVAVAVVKGARTSRAGIYDYAQDLIRSSSAVPEELQTRVTDEIYRRCFPSLLQDSPQP